MKKSIACFILAAAAWLYIHQSTPVAVEKDGFHRTRSTGREQSALADASANRQ